MKYIIISGIDGSGKTAVIDGLISELNKRNKSTFYIWLRFNHYSIKIMNALARILKLSVPVSNEFGNVWEHRFYKSSLFCKIYIFCSYLDNYIAKNKVRKFKTDYIVCDRWINDTLIDLGAECRIENLLESKWYSRFNKLRPENSIQFVIDRKKEDIIECRIENRTNPDFPYRFKLYEKLKRKENVITIDNTGTIECSVSQIMNHLGEL